VTTGLVESCQSLKMRLPEHWRSAHPAVGKMDPFHGIYRMTLDGTTLAKITPLLISVEGQWSPALDRDWRGLANAPEPFVALVFLCVRGACKWIKSQKGEATRELRLSLIPYDESGKDVQVNFSVGRGYALGRLEVPSAAYQPEISGEQTFQSGVVQKFTQVVGDPSLDLLILFLARRDVHSARNGLWHLRPEIAESINSDSIRNMMTYGRTGNLPHGTI
jgi:hypothetical protein